MKKTREQLSAELREMEKKVPPFSTWRHLKTGGVYEVISHCFLTGAATPAVLYIKYPLDTSPIWARDGAEFLDGRFERVGDAS